MSTLAQRLAAKLGEPTNTGCLEWTAYRNLKGYGWIYDAARGGPVLAHRAAYGLAYGAIPDGLWVLHRCDNPPCCNPAHLFLGTPADNLADMVAKGRSATGDRHWSRRTPDSVARGERSGSTHLTAAQVLEIRAAYRAGGVTQRELGEQYGVSRRAITHIVRGTTWSHVPEPPAPPADTSMSDAAFVTSMEAELDRRTVPA